MVGFNSGTNHHYLHRIEQESFQSQPVTACVEAKVRDDAGEGGECVFGDFAVLRAAAQGFKAQQ
jgi:hypothetical protein